MMPLGNIKPERMDTIMVRMITIAMGTVYDT